MNTMECQTVNVTEAAAVLGVCRTTAYKLIRRGEIPALRLGRRFLVPRAALERLLREPQNRSKGPGVFCRDCGRSLSPDQLEEA